VLWPVFATMPQPRPPFPQPAPPRPAPTRPDLPRPAPTRPGPQRNADALALGLRAICYELNCPKDEAVALILDNQSILHGREMHLSVADIAHLAMLRQPTGRIID
jgi:hypothetical protein